MGLLDRRLHWRLALAAGLAAAAWACFASEERGEAEERGLVFSHRVHVEEGLGCTDCHAGAEDADEPGMPSQPQCMLCHADLDEQRPPERQVATLFEDGRFQAIRARRSPTS